MPIFATFNLRTLLFCSQPFTIENRPHHDPSHALFPQFRSAAQANFHKPLSILTVSLFLHVFNGVTFDCFFAIVLLPLFVTHSFLYPPKSSAPIEFTPWNCLKKQHVFSLCAFVVQLHTPPKFPPLPMPPSSPHSNNPKPFITDSPQALYGRSCLSATSFFTTYDRDLIMGTQLA